MSTNLRRGDHVYVSYGFYTHHGIYVGDDAVVAFCKKPADHPDGPPRICKISTAEFADGRKIRVRNHAPSECSPAEKVVARALSHVGATGYHLLSGNCEHFATWCKTGRFRSSQVETFARRIVAMERKAVAQRSMQVAAKRIAGVAAKQAGKRFVKTGGKLVGRAAVRLNTPLLFVADGVQLVVEHGAATLSGADPKTARQLGAASGLASSAGIGLALGGPPGAFVAVGLWL
ncbi:MAG: lecithin retinol acyltransferase family protein, partial [Thermogutta sp.]|nr:lecithin retinol acyltransferase family protein [Thermogutta sp.]